MNTDPPQEGVLLRQFTILVDQLPTAEQVGALAERFDDLGVGRNPRKAIGHVYVDRRARSTEEAILSAVQDVESVGLRPIRVEGNSTVTVEEIADRIGETREAVRRWSAGKQGAGRFPYPLNPGGDTPFYDWADVVTWLRERMDLDVPEVETVLAAANIALKLRGLAPQVERVDLLYRLIDAE